MGAVRARTALFAVAVTAMFLAQTVYAQAPAAPTPVSELAPEDREAFIDLYLDVFVRGDVQLNDTPGDYFFTPELEQDLTSELISRIRNESPDMAREMDPLVAGPMLGISPEDDPLTGFDGEPVTEQAIADIYGGFVGSLVFEREPFLAELSAFMEELTPEQPIEDINATQPNATMMRNLVYEELTSEPIQHWDNVLTHPVVPDRFTPRRVEGLTPTPPEPIPSNMTRAIRESPFSAATPEEWLQPGFRLGLTDLLAHLSSLTDLPQDDILRLLGLVAKARGEVVERVRGPLAAFPDLAAKVAQIDAVAAEVEASYVTLVPNLVTAVNGAVDLPDAVEDLLEDLSESTSRSSTYSGVVNNHSFNGTWGAPQAIDLDGDDVPDVTVDLSNHYERTSVGNGLLAPRPRLTLDRTSVSYAVLDELGAPIDAAPMPLDVTIGFYLPDGETLVAYQMRAEDALDHLEATLVDGGPGVDVRTLGGAGEFTFATIVQDADTHVISMTTPAPPAQFTMGGVVDAASGQADAEVTSLVATDFEVEALATGASGRLALRVEGAHLTRLRVYTDGEEMRVETDDGATVALDRQESVDGTPFNFTHRAMAITNAASTTHATLGSDEVEVLAGQRGSDVSIVVAPVVDGEYNGGFWAEANASGRKLSISPQELVFESDIPIGRLRVTVSFGDLLGMPGMLEQNLLQITDDLLAFAINGTRSAEIVPNGDDYRIDLDTANPESFFIDLSQNNNSAQYLLSNLPFSTNLDLTPTGLAVGSSSYIAAVYGNLTRHLDNATSDPTNTVFAMEDITGTAGLGMLDATVNMFMDGGIGELEMLSSNVIEDGEHVFESLVGNHALANVVGELQQHSATMLEAVGNLTGGLFGTPGKIKIELIIDGPLCQAFGKDENRIEICFSNVPRSIALDFEALPDPTIRYNASDVIHEIRISLFAPDVEISLSILEIPRIIELKLGVTQLSINMSSRLGGILLTARLRNITLAAGIEDLPSHVAITWGLDGLEPVFDENEYIGRVFLFLDTPELSFMVDIVHIPLLTVGWGEGGIAVGIPNNQTIHSIRIQLLVDQLTLLVLAENVPGVEATWTDGAGTLQTTAWLDLIHVELTVGTNISLLLTVTDVPQIIATWDELGSDFALVGGKIGQIKLQFIVLDLLIYVQADGVPSVQLTRDDNGFGITAPTGIDSIALILAKGEGYYNPFERDMDFVGLYLRPENLTFGLSAIIHGLEGVFWLKDDQVKNQTLGVKFTADKDIQLLVNVQTSALIILLDAIIWNIAADTSLEFTPDTVSLAGLAIDPLREDPLLQARLYMGTPAAYAELVPPKWAYETDGLDHGITATTLLDPTNLSIATKWHVFVPLPDIMAFAKVTEENIPQVSAQVDASLGKVDLRTLVKMPLTSTITLQTLVVFTITNLPVDFSIDQQLGSDTSAGNPDLTINAGEPIDEVFLGVRFDNLWYGPRMTETTEDDFLDFGLPWVEWHESGETTLGFPIWLSVGDIPTSVGFTVGKDDWSQPDVPDFQYLAEASTLDAMLWIDIGILWDTFVKSDIIFATGVGRDLPDWIKGLANMDATGHLTIQVQNVPAQGVLIHTDADKIIVEVPQVCPPALSGACAERLGKFFFDFNFRLEEIHGDNGCWICTSVIQLGWHWSYGWALEIARFDFMLKDLKYVALKPGIESDLWLDGEILFDFKASVEAHFSAGISLHVKVFGIRFLIFCACIGAELKFIVAAGFISFQVLEKSWKVNYWTWGWPCGWDDWCHKHEYAGVEYTIPGNWRFDLPVEWPPLIEFRGLHIDSSDDGSGIQAYKVFLDPVIMFCIDTYAGIRVWASQPCFGTHLVPVIFYMAYAYITYFSIDGPKFWSVRHSH